MTSRQPIRWILILPYALLLSGIVGCTAPQKTSSRGVDSPPTSRSKYALLKKKQALAEDERERRLILESQGTGRDLSEGDWIHPSAETLKNADVNTRSLPPSRPLGKAKADLVSAETSAVTSANGDHVLYSKIISTYRSHSMPELEKTLGLLLKTYPDSIFADNALYLAGLLAFEANHLQIALKYMDRIAHDYPLGNKAVAALFARAEIEKRLAHATAAKSIYDDVRHRYPGSPEAMRAAVEIQLLGGKPALNKPSMKKNG